MVCIEWLESLALDHLRRGGKPQLPEEKLRKFSVLDRGRKELVRICSLSPSRSTMLARSALPPRDCAGPCTRAAVHVRSRTNL